MSNPTLPDPTPGLRPARPSGPRWPVRYHSAHGQYPPGGGRISNFDKAFDGTATLGKSTAVLSLGRDQMRLLRARSVWGTRESRRPFERVLSVKLDARLDTELSDLACRSMTGVVVIDDAHVLGPKQEGGA